MIVVDTNIIAYLFIEGKHTEAVESLLKKDSEWIAPRLWLDEFLNILCTYERGRLLTKNEVSEIIEDALLKMKEHVYEVPFDRVLTTARRTGCSAYDSQYVALAEDLSLDLYTFDKKILKECPEIAKKPT